METAIIMASLTVSDFFIITTHKTVTLLPGSPYGNTVEKEATYAILTGYSLRETVGSLRFLSFHGRPWATVDDSMRFATHNRTKEKYLLCAIDKGAKFQGKSTYTALDGRTYAKYELREWLPDEGKFNAEYFCVPFRTIVSIIPNDNYPRNDDAETPAEIETSVVSPLATLPEGVTLSGFEVTYTYTSLPVPEPAVSPALATPKVATGMIPPGMTREEYTTAREKIDREAKMTLKERIVPSASIEPMFPSLRGDCAARSINPVSLIEIRS